MEQNFTERARKVRQLAENQARWLHKKAIGAENLLYGLLQTGPNLATAIINKVLPDGSIENELGEAPGEMETEATQQPLEWDETCRRVVDRATHEAGELKHRFVGTEHLFLGLLAEQGGKAGDILRKAGLEYQNVRNELLAFIGAESAAGKAEAAQPQTTSAAGVEVRITQREDCKDLPLPRYMSEHASGMDLHAAVAEDVTIEPGRIRLVPTGLSIAVPPGYEAQVRPRSGLALKHGITIVNSPGTIDSDYRGEVGVIVGNIGTEPFVVERGMRIAQMVIQSVVRAKLIPSDNLDDTGRGDGGFGSSGL